MSLFTQEQIDAYDRMVDAEKESEKVRELFENGTKKEKFIYAAERAGFTKEQSQFLFDFICP